MADPLRLALVGPGGMGVRHLSCYLKMPDVKIVGVVDSTLDLAKPAAEMADCPPFDSLESLLSAVETDVVDITTPTFLHKRDALLAAKAGKRVICEKPLARTVSDAEEIAAACQNAGVTLQVGHVLRFFPQYAAAHEMVKSGAIGAPVIARTFRGGGFPHGVNEWYADFEKSGGLLLDLVLHDFDWLRWTFGEAERVYAKGLLKDLSKERDYALVTIRHESGVLSHVEGTWCHTTPFNMKLEVAGDRGLIDYDDAEARPVQFTPRDDDDAERPKVAYPESPLADDPYFLELRHFVDVIQGKAEPLITPKDGIEAIRIALAAIESVQTGKAVQLRR